MSFDTEGGAINCRTQRLMLRTWQPEDVAALQQINADPQVMRYFPSTLSEQETQALVERFMAHECEYGYGIYAVVRATDEQCLGFVGLQQLRFTLPTFVPQQLPVVEIGWRLGAAYWGQGYATEAAEAILAQAESWGLTEIVAFTVVDNLRSRRVMEKLGMRHLLGQDFSHPLLPRPHALSHHVLYRWSGT